MRLRRTQLITVVSLAITATACGSPTDGSNSASTIFEGVIAGDSTSGALNGTLTLTIATAAASLSVAAPTMVFDVAGAAASVPVTGTLTLAGGATVSLTGTYDTGTHGLTVSGGGYTFTGTFIGGILSGTFTTPGGGSGGFSTSSASGGTIYSYCGNAVASQNEGGARFNLVVNTGSNVASGFAVGNGDNATATLTGTVSGSNWSVVFTTTDGDPGTATGTFTSTALTGTYSITGTFPETGTISAVRCN